MSDKEPGHKRPRSTNFSLRETECLVEEVLKRAAIIENKETCAVTWKKKENAWKDLTETFNALTGTNRTIKMLKVKYDGIKRAMKKKHSNAKAEIFKTGGGAAEVVSYTPWEEKLLPLISLSVEGLPSENDCDEVENRNPHPNSPNIIIECVDDTGEHQGSELPTYGPTTSTAFSQEVHTIKEKSNTAELEGDSKWTSWTPQVLKTPRHKKLKTAIRKPTSATAQSPSVTADRYSSMANCREELINLQKQVATQELEKIHLEMELLRKADARKEEEHRLKIEFEQKEHILRVELLKLQKDHLLKEK